MTITGPTLALAAPGVRPPLAFEKLAPLLIEAADRGGLRPGLAEQLAGVLFRLERWRDLIDRFAPLLASGAASGPVLEFVGRAAMECGDLELAQDALRKAVAAGHARAFGPLGQAQLRLGRADDAFASALGGLDADPADAPSLAIVARRLLESDDRDRLWTICEGLRARGVWGGYLPSAMTLAAATPDRIRQMAAAIDWPAWLHAERLDTPDGLAQGVAAEILSHPNLRALPSVRSTLGAGLRVEGLEADVRPGLATLHQQIAASVNRYVAERQRLVDSPMIATQPAALALVSWGLAVTQDGHEDWHVHPSGWLSGVYYAATPRDLDPSDDLCGAIKFAPFPFGAPRRHPAWTHQIVQPQQGTLLLFPSGFGHRTFPTRSSEPRICVAFDVVPRSAAGAA